MQMTATFDKYFLVRRHKPHTDKTLILTEP